MISLEDMLVGKGFADLPASPLQIAIARAAQGRPLAGAIDADACEKHFGVSELQPVVPALVVLVAGVRGGKSFIAACAAITSCLSADLSSLKEHELPRFAIIGPTVDAARAMFVLLLGILQSSDVLSGFIDGEPTADTVVIVRPDGRRVEIVVVAAHRGGLSVRNRWLVGFVLEEVAQFGNESSGSVVNGEEILRAASTRLIAGCQGWLISSPFGPVGLLHEIYKKHFGRPGRTLVVHAPTRALNPSFPQATIDEIAAEDPDTAAREYGAEWVDADSAFLAAALVEPAIRSVPLYRTGRATVAAMDPATRGNAWTLAVAWTEQTRLDVVGGPPVVRSRVIVGGVWSWTGSKSQPLSPRATLIEIGNALRPYGVSRVYVDGWSFDAMQDHARAAGLTLVEHPASERDEPYKALRTLLGNGDIELPPDPVMRADLLSIRQRATASGIKIHLPKTSNGRHCDFAPSVALASMHAVSGNVGVLKGEVVRSRMSRALDPSDTSSGVEWARERGRRLEAEAYGLTYRRPRNKVWD